VNDWKQCTLADLGEIVGGATPSTKNEKYYGGDIAWITPKDLSTFKGRFISRGERNVTADGLKNSSARLMPKHSVLFTSRAPIGYVSIAENEVCTNQGFKSVVPNAETDYLFLYYLLVHNRDRIENMGSGTTFKEVSGSVIKGIAVSVPTNIEEQKAIARVFGSLDDKIENNTAINHHLEQMSQAIFKSWFVDFEPFGGVMPDNWQITRLGDLPVTVTDYVANGSFASLKENVALFKTPSYAIFIRNVDLKAGNFEKYVDEHSYRFLSKSTLLGGEVIISNVGDVGSVFLCPYLPQPMTLGNNMIMLKAKEDKLQNYFYYLLFKHSYGVELIRAITGGSTQPKFNKTDFRSLQVTMPTKDVMGKFLETVVSLFQQQANLIQESATLVILREKLLPRLMSGELSVADLATAK